MCRLFFAILSAQYSATKQLQDKQGKGGMYKDKVCSTSVLLDRWWHLRVAYRMHIIGVLGSMFRSQLGRQHIPLDVNLQLLGHLPRQRMRVHHQC